MDNVLLKGDTISDIAIAKMHLLITQSFEDLLLNIKLFKKTGWFPETDITGKYVQYRKKENQKTGKNWYEINLYYIKIL